MSVQETVGTQSDRLTGQVKWFNNKAGYGFITVCSGEHKDKDIFTHYSGIRVTNSQYKYLIQGEYVEFGLTKSENDKHEFQSVDITGISGGPLMCETRKSLPPTTGAKSSRPRSGSRGSAPKKIEE